MTLLDALGLDIKIFIAQLVNFSILIFVLWRFAYKPVFKILEERRQKIAKGVKDSEKAEERLKEAETEKEEIISSARKEANNIIEEAKGKAELRYQEIVTKAKTDLKIVIEDEKEKIGNERKKAIIEIKKEAVTMIAEALTKIFPEKTDEKTDIAMIEKALSEMNNYENK